MNEDQLKKVRDLLNQIKKLSRDTGFANPFSEDRRFVSDDTIRDITNVGEVFKELTSYIRVLQTELKTLDNEFVGIMSSINQTIGEITGSYTKEAETLIKRGLRGIRTISADLAAESEATIKLTVKQLEDLDKRLVKNIGLIESNQQYIESLSNEKEEIRRERERLEAKQKIFGLTDKEASALDKIQDRYESIRTLESVLAAERKGSEVGISSVIKQRISERKVEEDQVKKLSGLTGAIAKSTKDLLSTLGLASIADFLDIESIESRIDTKAREENEKITEAIKKGATPSEQRKLKRSASLGIIGEGFKGVGKSISKVFTDVGTQLALVAKGLIFVFKQIKDILFDIDEQAGKIAKQFNITYQEAVALRSELAQAAIATEDIFVNSQSLQKSLSTINRITGTRVLSGLGNNLQQNVVFLTQLAERAGLAESAIARIAQVSFSTGVSAEDLVSTLTAQVELRNLNEDQLFNEKAIFDEISKLSSATLLSLSQYPTQISDAFFDAKLLGLELSKVDNIAAGFTDFGTSIRTELEAIVVTGKQLNLNAARFYALNNDTAGVAREISKQIGTSAEFANMNRIAQESLAKAFNMSRDEVADILLIQDQLLGLSEREATAREKELTALRATVGEQRFRQAIEEKNVDRLLEQVSITDRFRASIARIKDALIPLLTPLTSIVNSLAYVLEGIPKALSSIKSFGEGVGTFFGNVVDGFKELFRQISEGIEAFQNNTIVKGIASLFETGSIYGTILREVESEDANEVASSGVRMTNPAISRQLQSGTTIPFASGQRGVVSPVVNNESLQTVSNETMSSVSSQNVINTTQANVDTSELVAAMKKSNELIEQQTKVLAQGQEAIRTQKQNLVVGATSLGTQINTNSYRVQYG